MNVDEDWDKLLVQADPFDVFSVTYSDGQTPTKLEWKISELLLLSEGFVFSLKSLLVENKTKT